MSRIVSWIGGIRLIGLVYVLAGLLLLFARFLGFLSASAFLSIGALGISVTLVTLFGVDPFFITASAFSFSGSVENTHTFLNVTLVGVACWSILGGALTIAAATLLERSDARGVTIWKLLCIMSSLVVIANIVWLIFGWYPKTTSVGILLPIQWIWLCIYWFLYRRVKAGLKTSVSVLDENPPII
jgi:hypothetical protein